MAPIYVYEILDEDGEAMERFEHLQEMDSETLTHDPESGRPVRRVVTAPNLPSRHADSVVKNQLNDNKRLGEMGFTKYVRSGKGTYEKHAGKGPDIITSD
jgi:hypothetical protein